MPSVTLNLVRLFGDVVQPAVPAQVVDAAERGLRVYRAAGLLGEIVTIRAGAAADRARDPSIDSW